uniref:Uncharacterized protein n=1 Tax=Siphoviridae sp. ctXZx16 TaxID=2826371 RepID=A0A8S5MKT5_9CAUD|nr:MAG TPA: hypothetical protein [Siphoviridae sp. ctXZx16]
MRFILETVCRKFSYAGSLQCQLHYNIRMK